MRIGEKAKIFTVAVSMAIIICVITTSMVIKENVRGLRDGKTRRFIYHWKTMRSGMLVDRMREASNSK